MDTVWTFAVGSITARLRIEYDYGYRFDGDDEGGEIQSALDSGEMVAFDSLVEIVRNGHVIGSDSLSGSVYHADRVSEFWTDHRSADPMNRNCSLMRAARGDNVSICHYFPSMVSAALADARDTLGCKSPLERAAAIVAASPIPEPSSVASTLTAHGFESWMTGGGCVAMAKSFGPEVYILVTDGGGADYPTDSDWLVGVYDDDQHYDGHCVDQTSGLTFEAALRGAIEKAETLDMEQSARRRGDI